jgi:hypothetical protein
MYNVVPIARPANDIKGEFNSVKRLFGFPAKNPSRADKNPQVPNSIAPMNTIWIDSEFIPTLRTVSPISAIKVTITPIIIINPSMPIEPNEKKKLPVRLGLDVNRELDIVMNEPDGITVILPKQKAGAGKGGEGQVLNTSHGTLFMLTGQVIVVLPLVDDPPVNATNCSPIEANINRIGKAIVNGDIPAMNVSPS